MPAGVAVSGEVYILVLTGVGNNTTDVVLPMTSINLRWMIGGLAWISVVIPNGINYALDIAARPLGEMVILRGEKWSNGWTVISETLRAPLALSRLDSGSLSNSYTLQGYSDMLTSAVGNVSIPDPLFKFWGGLPKTRPPEIVPLQGITFKRGTAGGHETRSLVDTFIRPGDTVTYLAGGFIARSIQWTINESSREMLIAE